MNTTPIEFMAWDKKRNEWVHERPCNILGETILLCEWMRRPNGDHVRLEELNDIAIMQRTALRSINDEPIYNHMIVKNEFGDHFLVDMFNYPIMEFLTRFDLEIVGNRFQHPELLEMCK